MQCATVDEIDEVVQVLRGGGIGGVKHVVDQARLSARK